MEFSFPWPMSQGEWLAWSAAAATVLFGLFTMFMPRLALRFFGLQPKNERTEVLVMPRAVIGGFHVGFGLTAILLAQPFIYLAFGAAWGVAAFGCIISMLSDGARALSSWAFLLASLLLCTLPLAFVLGFIP
ncbi:DUF4345 domain-containing protein [Nitratireductor sp. ZSWI3]|uniref:AGROH133_08824 family phage infection protein n=1 Tax=Nitratireductor sp. ZSWI3 TaxID=2966359 RepID=UPI00214FF47F|nr:DUF4345 domain-containing protein [Nitratireductor sp. ZSWI3]MCR4267852.1 DUF4345 domain-containing protein [Nitratireductor sp. ZSWI3]